MSLLAEETPLGSGMPAPSTVVVVAVVTAVSRIVVVVAVFMLNAPGVAAS